MSDSLDGLWAIVLAAGKGKRMNAKAINKVAYEVLGKPMIVRAIENLKSSGIINIIVVVGYAKKSVINLLSEDILVVEQKKRLGTANAVEVGLSKVPSSASNILVLNGDDALFLTSSLFKKLYRRHLEKGSKVSFLTAIMDDPNGLGRVIRDKKNITGIIEERNATESQKKIKEVNAACYLFEYDFLSKNIHLIKKNLASGEYYIVDLVNIAYKKNMPIEGIEVSDINWRGINTVEELHKAERVLSRG